MMQLQPDPTIAQALALLTSYGFEMRGDNAQELIKRWLKQYQPLWVRLAVVEALYQGRYKAISVEQILNVWWRRGNPTFHFNHEFERLICHRLPLYSHATSEVSQSDSVENGNLWTLQSEIASLPLPFNALTPDEKKTVTPSQEKVQTSPELTATVASDATKITPEKETWIVSAVNQHPLAKEENLASEKLTILPEKNSLHSSRSIDQFTPSLEESEFYLKLKAVADS
jgi:hypothetical protein